MHGDPQVVGEICSLPKRLQAGRFPAGVSRWRRRRRCLGLTLQMIVVKTRNSKPGALRSVERLVGER